MLGVAIRSKREFMTTDEVGLIVERCLAERDSGLTPKSVGTRDYEKWRVGKGIVETWEGQLHSITEQNVRDTTYRVLDHLKERPNAFKMSAPPRIDPLPGLDVNAVSVVRGSLILTFSLQFDAAAYQEVLAVACYPSEL
jgi:hypothetical protein